MLRKWRYHTSFMHAFKELPKRILFELHDQKRDLVLLQEISASHSTEVAFSSNSIPQLNASLYTQAYCKFIEILMVYPELTQISTPDTLK